MQPVLKMNCLFKKYVEGDVFKFIKINKDNLEVLCRWILASVFLFAGFPKLFDIKKFAEIIDAYGLVPDSLLLVVAFTLALAEVISGVGILFNRKFALHIMAALLVIFIAILAYAIWQGFDIDCGCFSINDPEHSAFSGLRLAIVRDLFLLLPLLWLYWREFSSKIEKGVRIEKV